ncbi:GNAT family N-acetyltransferase [Streptomyces sp. NPDC004166]
MKVEPVNARLHRILSNCRHFWLGYGQATDDLTDARGLTMYRSGIASAMYNGVLCISPGTDIGGAYDEATRKLATVPSVWWVGPDSDTGTAEYLCSKGLSSFAAMTVMEIDLAAMGPADIPTGISVHRVEGLRDIASWVLAYTPSFGLSPDVADAVIERYRVRPEAPGVLERFEARDGERIVGTSVLLDRDGVAGVYVVTTAEEYRGRGLGTALTTEALTRAREKGLRVGTLQTSTARSMYERMGFQAVAEYKVFTGLGAAGR